MKNIYVFMWDIEYSMKFCEYEWNTYAGPRTVDSFFWELQNKFMTVSAL